MKLLENYQNLVKKVDALCLGIRNRFPQHVACRRGCDACCRHLSLFWVEAVALALAIEELDEAGAEQIHQRARRATPEGPCPLLEEGSCLLYTARPIICRTHGMALLTGGNGRRQVDFCPQNFRDLGSLPASAVIDLEKLNATLATVNALFVAELFGDETPSRQRLTIAEALLLDL
jgi:hypothetical protein